MGWWSARIARWQSAGGAPPPKDHGWAVLLTVIAAIVTTGAIVYVVTMAPGVLNRLPLHYNWSLSLPTGFNRPSFLDALARGDLVRVCLPEAHAALALERGYLYPSAYARAARSRWPRCWSRCQGTRCTSVPPTRTKARAW